MINASQPKHIPSIDWSNPLTRGLVSIIVGDTTYDVVQGKMLQPTNQLIDKRYDLTGSALLFPGTSGLSAGTVIPNTGSLTLFGVASTSSSAASNQPIIGMNDSVALKFYSGFLAFYSWNGTTWDEAKTNNLTNFLNYPVVGVGVHNGISNKLSAAMLSPATTGIQKETISVSASARTLIGTNGTNYGVDTDSATYLTGKIYLAGVSTRAWSDAEMASFIANPWQIFKSNKKNIANLYKQVPAPNPTYRKRYAIGYENSSPTTESAGGGGMSGRYSGYSFNTSWSNTWTSPSSVSLTVAPAAGDFMFLVIDTSIGTSGAASAITDNAGGVWTNIINADLESVGSNRHSFWYCSSAPLGMTSISATFTGGYPTSVKMVAMSYKNMTGSTLLAYTPQKSQTNPGVSVNSIQSNTSFNNASSNTTGFRITADRALLIGYHINATSTSTPTWVSGQNFKTRKDYVNMHLQDAEYIANDTVTITTAAETAGGSSNTYVSYGFAFSQPVINNNLFYTAKAGDVLTTFRFRGRATFAAQSADCFIGLRRVDTNEIVYAKTVRITYQPIHTLWEFPVAWHLTAGITYALFIVSLDSNTIVSRDTLSTYGESSGGSEYTVGSTWSDTQTTFGGYSDNFRYIISGDVTNTYGIKYKDCGTFYPSSATAVSPSIKVQKGDLILVRAVWAGGSPGNITIVDNSGQFYNSEYNTGLGTNGVNQEGGVPHYHYAWDTTALISSDNFQFTITNSNSLTPYLIQYAIYSSPFPFFIQTAYRGIVYGIGGTGNAEAYTFLTERPFVTAVLADSGNTTPTSGDYLYPQATAAYATNRQSIVGVNGVTPATLIYDINGIFAANGSADFGSSGVYTSLGASNGKTAAFSRHWQFFSGPSNYRQAAAREQNGVITMKATKPRSLVIVFVQTVGNATSVSDNKGTQYTRLNIGNYTPIGLPHHAIFYGYPQEGMTQITVTGGNTTSYAVEEPEMQLVDVYSSNAVDTNTQLVYNAGVSPGTYSANTSMPDIGYIFLGQTGSLVRPGIKSIGDTLWAPVAGTDIDPITGERINTSYGASAQLLRAELSQSTNAVAVVSSLPEKTSFSSTVTMVFLKKPQLMLGPDVTKWNMPYYPTGYVTGPGINCTWYQYGYQARFSGYTTAVKYAGTGASNAFYMAVYDSDGAYLGRSSGTATQNGGVISLPISVYLEKGKTYYIAFITNEVYFTMYGNYNASSYRMASYSSADWTYSATTPPANLVGTTLNGVGEVAMWIEGIPSSIKQYTNGILDSGQLIETY